MRNNIPANIPDSRRWRIEGTDVIDQFYRTPHGTLTSVGRDIVCGRVPQPSPEDNDRVLGAFYEAMNYLDRS